MFIRYLYSPRLSPLKSKKDFYMRGNVKAEGKFTWGPVPVPIYTKRILLKI
jgi:hypothetical protein